MSNLAIFTSPLHLISMLGVIGSGVIFYLYGKKAATETNLSIDGYLLSQRKMSGKAFANTFAASNLSLASNIIFFIEAHKQYGFWMALCPMIYVAMQFWLLAFLRKAKLSDNSCRTLAELWHKVFPSKIVTHYISVVSFVGAVMGMFVEIYIGSIILSIFLPDVIFYKSLSFFFLGMVVLGYVRLGGYRAIVKTDAWQLVLIILACIAIGLFAFLSPTITPVATGVTKFTSLFNFEASGYNFYVFLAWVCLGNLCLCLTDVSVWQRINAATSVEIALDGLKRGVWKIAFVYWVPTLSFVYLAAKGYNFSSFAEFLAVVEQYSGIYGVVIYPIIVVGFGAALFSTADTMMIAALYSICDNTTFLPILEKMPQNIMNQVLRKYLTFAALFFIAALTLLYYIQFQDLANWFMPIMYTIWSQISILSPLAVYGLFRMKLTTQPIAVSPIRSILLIVMLLSSSCIILYGAKQEAKTRQHIYSQIAFLQAITITALGTYLIMPKLHAKTVSFQDNFSLGQNKISKEPV